MLRIKDLITEASPSLQLLHLYLAERCEMFFLAFARTGLLIHGLLRDVLCQLEPVLLHRETIGTSALMGAITFIALDQLDVSQNLAAIIGGLVVILTRVISIQFDLHLPKFRK